MIKKSTPSLFEKSNKRLTNHAKISLLQAQDIANQLGDKKVKNIHLFYSIFCEEGSMGSIIMQDLGIKKKFFNTYLKTLNPPSASQKTKLINNLQKISTSLKNTLLRAHVIAKELNYAYVGTEHLVYTLLESKNKEISSILSKLKEKSINPHQIKEALRETSQPQNSLIAKKNFNFNFNNEFMSNIPSDTPANLTAGHLDLTQFIKNNKKTSPTPYTDNFCLNINKRVTEKKEIIIGRKKELQRIIHILGRKNKNNPLLLGYPGVGKTAIIYGLAQLINTGQVPTFLLEKRIMSLDIASLIAGTSFRGEFETRLKEILKEITTHKNIILFIDELHTIVGAGNIPGGLDLANILKPALAEGNFKLIGATTFSEYKKYIEKDTALERRFQSVAIQEPSLVETKKILLGVKKHYEDFHNVSISSEVIDLSVELSDRYLKNRYLPDKAIDILDEAASNLRSQRKISATEIKLRQIQKRKQQLTEEKENLINLENYQRASEIQELEKKDLHQITLIKKQLALTKQKNRKEIKPVDIFKTFSHISGIPEEKLAQSNSKKIKNLGKKLAQQIIGQSKSLEKIHNAILRSQSGISNLDRPLGSFLFMGPTGIGKTLTAKTLAQELFSNSASLIRIDMSEFMERHTISSLIGSPAGYVGYGEGGRLTEKVKKNPYSVVLFDEIEKAHPDIHNILLQILEDGLLTDAEGTEINFKNTLIILTTNIGTNDFTTAAKIGFESKKSIPFTSQFKSIEATALRALKKKIRPELINRLDNILVFNPLNIKELKKITELEIKKVKARLKKQDIKLLVATPVLHQIAQKSLSANQGARLVRKNIQEMIENKIAEMIIHERIQHQQITIKLKNNKLNFS